MPARRFVLVGDPQQLPATVLSKTSKALAFDRSLFERLMLAGWPVRRLSVQYRMHAAIRAFPSRHFYDNALVVRAASRHPACTSSTACTDRGAVCARVCGGACARLQTQAVL